MSDVPIPETRGTEEEEAALRDQIAKEKVHQRLAADVRANIPPPVQCMHVAGRQHGRLRLQRPHSGHHTPHERVEATSLPPRAEVTCTRGPLGTAAARSEHPAQHAVAGGLPNSPECLPPPEMAATHLDAPRTWMPVQFGKPYSECQAEERMSVGGTVGGHRGGKKVRMCVHASAKLAVAAPHRGTEGRNAINAGSSARPSALMYWKHCRAETWVGFGHCLPSYNVTTECTPRPHIPRFLRFLWEVSGQGQAHSGCLLVLT